MSLEQLFRTAVPAVIVTCVAFACGGSEVSQSLDGGRQCQPAAPPTAQCTSHAVPIVGDVSSCGIGGDGGLSSGQICSTFCISSCCDHSVNCQLAKGSSGEDVVLCIPTPCELDAAVSD